MSHLSDPDRLERQAMYVLRGESLAREVAEALNDAADRMRRTEAQLTELLRPTRAKSIPFKHDGEVVGSAIVEQDAEGFNLAVTTDDPRFKGMVGRLPPLPWKFDDVHSFGFQATEFRDTFTPAPASSLRDFIARAIADDGVARYGDKLAASAVLAMPELRAIRLALRGMAETLADEFADHGFTPGKWLQGPASHDDTEWALPPSVVAWVMEDDTCER